MKPKIVAIFFLIALVFLSSKVKAQLPSFSLYVHGLYATALDNSTQNRYNGGLGATAGVTLGSKNTRGVLSLGYSDFFSKNDSPDHNLGDETYIPVKIGIRQYLPLTLHALFVQGNLGVGFVGYKSTANVDNRFAADIGAGAHFGAFEAALVWDSFKEPKPLGWSSWLTFQLGFNIGF